ncbi:MAG: amidohydrolase [Candidatus Izemoplasmatales bacterium]
MSDLYENARFFTGEGFAEAVLVEDGRFAFVGSGTEARTRHRGGAAVDLGGALVVPGFNDSHMHLYGMALMNERPGLQGVRSVSELQERLRAHLASPRFTGGFLLARGFDQNRFDVVRFPTRADLDAVDDRIPIVVTRVCGHVAVLNTPALKRSGIDASTRVDGGSIDFADGILAEKALDLVFSNRLPTTKAEVRRLLLAGMRLLNRDGITTVQTDDLSHAFPGDYERMIEVYRELAEEGLLTVRIRAQSHLPTLAMLADYIAKGYPNRRYGDFLKMGPLKLLLDGSLGARTAAMSAPYADDSGTSGILTYSDEELHELVATAHRAGMSVAMHAIGDRAMTQALDVYERVLGELPRPDHRHALIHCQITTDAILARMARLDVYAAVQPIFIDADMAVVEARVGAAKAVKSYAWKTMQDLGINVAFGTDAPVEDANPFENLRAAVRRTDRAGRLYRPDQKMPVADAIRAYTVASARQTRDERELGSIATGMRADFAVLPPDAFERIEGGGKLPAVRMTFVGGKRVF